MLTQTKLLTLLGALLLTSTALASDPQTERTNVEQWRAEAERVPDRHMRAFCLREAWECVRRLLIASGTPIIREHSECNEATANTRTGQPKSSNRLSVRGAALSR